MTMRKSSSSRPMATPPPRTRGGSAYPISTPWGPPACSRRWKTWPAGTRIFTSHALAVRPSSHRCTNAGGGTMASCITVFGLLLGGICGCGLSLGFLLHWLVLALDRGMATLWTLCGLVATGVALLAFGQLLALAEPLEAEDESLPVWR